jgi:hypothetical protein
MGSDRRCAKGKGVHCPAGDGSGGRRRRTVGQGLPCRAVHRKFVISGDVSVLRDVARGLESLAEVITLALDESGSLKPRGGVLQVQALNRSADEVLRRVHAAAKAGQVVIAIDSTSSVYDAERQELIDRDADEMLWEEMEQNLRNMGRLSPNSLVLMALGGVIAAAGVASGPLIQISAFIGASIIAPGFDNIAGISLGLVLRRWRVALHALRAVAGGYGVAAGAAAVTFLVLRAFHVERAARVINEGVTEIIDPATAPLVISAAAACAGALMIVSLRDIYVVGPLIALVLVPAAAVFGCAVAASDWTVALAALERVGIDALCVILLAAAVFWIKQRTVHRRKPLA